MANVLVQDTSLTAIADAIRAKNGETTQYKPAEMATAIAAIPSGGSGGGLNIDWENDVLFTTNSAANTITLPDGYTIDDIKLAILPTAGSTQYGATVRYFFAAPGVLTPNVSNSMLRGIVMGAYGTSSQTGGAGISLYLTDHQQVFNYSSAYIMRNMYLTTSASNQTILEGYLEHPETGAKTQITNLAVGRGLIVLKNKEVT